MATPSVTTLFRAVTGQFNSNVRKATTTLNKYGKAAEITAGKTSALNNSMRGASVSAGLLSNALKGIGLGQGVSIGAIGLAISKLGAAAIAAAAAFEDIQIRFNTFTGSGLKTAAIFDQITDTALRTGTQLSVLRETQSRLQFLVAQGTLTQTQLNTILQKYANLAALSGTSTLDLALSMRGFAQAAASPIVQMQEIRQIAEAIPSLFSGFSGAFDLGGESLRDFVAEGGATQNVFLNAIPQALDIAANSAEANADRISASWRNVANATTLVLESVGFQLRDIIIGFNEATAAAIDSTGGLVDNFIKNIKILGDLAVASTGEVEIIRGAENEIEKVRKVTLSLSDFLANEWSQFLVDLNAVGRLLGGDLLIGVADALDTIFGFRRKREAAAADIALRSRIELLKELNRISGELKSADFDAVLDSLSNNISPDQLSVLVKIGETALDKRKETNNKIISLEKQRTAIEKEINEDRIDQIVQTEQRALRAAISRRKKVISELNREKTTLIALEKTYQNDIQKIVEKQLGTQAGFQAKIGQLEREGLSGRRKRAAIDSAFLSATIDAQLTISKLATAIDQKERDSLAERAKAQIDLAESINDERDSRRDKISGLKTLASLSQSQANAEIKGIEKAEKARSNELALLDDQITKLEGKNKLLQGLLDGLSAKKIDNELFTKLKNIEIQLKELIALKAELAKEFIPSVENSLGQTRSLSIIPELENRKRLLKEISDFPSRKEIDIIIDQKSMEDSLELLDRVSTLQDKIGEFKIVELPGFLAEPFGNLEELQKERDLLKDVSDTVKDIPDPWAFVVEVDDTSLQDAIEKLNEIIRLRQLVGNFTPSGRLNPSGPDAAFAHGGNVPGSGRGDRVRALLEPREFVLRRSAALSLGPGVLNTLNRGGMRGLQRLIAKGVGSKSGNIHVPTLPAGVIQGRQSGGFINPTGNEQRVILDVRLPNGRGESIPTTKDGGEAIARLFAEFANL